MADRIDAYETAERVMSRLPKGLPVGIYVDACCSYVTSLPGRGWTKDPAAVFTKVVTELLEETKC